MFPLHKLRLSRDFKSTTSRRGTLYYVRYVHNLLYSGRYTLLLLLLLLLLLQALVLAVYKYVLQQQAAVATLLLL